MNAKSKIDYVTVLQDGFGYGMKNIPSLLGAIALWILTIWIPYVNVGTTIALCTLPLQLSRGEVFSPLSIFDRKYYRYMGEYFLLLGLMGIGIIGAALFFFIPGLVVSIAWSLSVLLLLDRGMNAAEAIRMSNKLTYGNKWTIFFVGATVYIASATVIFILSLLFGLINVGILAATGFANGAIVGVMIINLLSFLLTLAVLVITLAFYLGCQASIYGTLSKNMDEAN
jgi:hypothetical protein